MKPSEERIADALEEMVNRIKYQSKCLNGLAWAMIAVALALLLRG